GFVGTAPGREGEWRDRVGFFVDQQKQPGVNDAVRQHDQFAGVDVNRGAPGQSDESNVDDLFNWIGLVRIDGQVDHRNLTMQLAVKVGRWHVCELTFAVDENQAGISGRGGLTSLSAAPPPAPAASRQAEAKKTCHHYCTKGPE